MKVSSQANVPSPHPFLSDTDRKVACTQEACLYLFTQAGWKYWGAKRTKKHNKEDESESVEIGQIYPTYTSTVLRTFPPSGGSLSEQDKGSGRRVFQRCDDWMTPATDYTNQIFKSNNRIFDKGNQRVISFHLSHDTKQLLADGTELEMAHKLKSVFYRHLLVKHCYQQWKHNELMHITVEGGLDVVHYLNNNEEIFTFSKKSCMFLWAPWWLGCDVVVGGVAGRCCKTAGRAADFGPWMPTSEVVCQMLTPLDTSCSFPGCVTCFPGAGILWGTEELQQRKRGHINLRH